MLMLIGDPFARRACLGGRVYAVAGRAQPDVSPMPVGCPAFAPPPATGTAPAAQRRTRRTAVSRPWVVLSARFMSVSCEVGGDSRASGDDEAMPGRREGGARGARRPRAVRIRRRGDEAAERRADGTGRALP